jgi:proton-dependent oligopeptide transporter, POT family
MQPPHTPSGPEATGATDKPMDERTSAGVIHDSSGIAGHPRGLTTLFFTEMWERFSYYGMRALLILFMTAPVAAGGLGFDVARAGAVYGVYTGSVYFTTIPGGWIADRLLGQRKAVLIGGIIIALGHYMMLLRTLPTFYAGLTLIALGTGLLKGNIASIVGQLYSEKDPRRDAGFSIFYMGINLGAFTAPLICSYLGETVGWHWGFAAAGVGMTFGVIQYVLGVKRLGGAGERLQKPENPGQLWAGVIGIMLALIGVLAVFWDQRYYIVIALTAVLFTWLVRQGTPGIERRKLSAIVALFIFATLFWAAFEQAGSSLNLFARDVTDRVLPAAARGLGDENGLFPAGWFQSVNSMFLIALAPVFAWLWLRLARSGKEPSSPAKFAYGLFFVGLGFLIVAGGALAHVRTGQHVSPMWLVALYLCHTIGELLLSPVGMSTVTKLAPARLVGSMMGVWYLSISLGNFIGGSVAGLFETFPLPQLFGAVFATTFVAALILAALSRPIRNLMSGVH